MTTLAPRLGPASSAAPDDVPIDLRAKPAGGDRVFDGILAGSSGVVLLILAGVVIFLCYYGFPALREAGYGIRLFTDKTWDPDTKQFGMLPLLLGSIAIALIGVAIATPISVSTALMINEYGPRRLKPFLTGVVDLVPIFRTYSPGQYVKSIFACGLICSVTIIPIITSITREVMSQVPRDVCEAALGLGGTRWGMVTDVVLPFSRNGMLGAVLLGFGRGLGETMIVVLVLSPGNHLTSALMGPGGLGSIALQITENFVTTDPITQSGLILLALVLFLTTLAVNIIARLIVQRSGKVT
jgi:phosphate transport system permease protein